jgi:F-type H+-transporting ATPase subunit gamma
MTPDDHHHVHHSTDYLYDSDKKDILDALVPALLKTELFHALLSSHVSEHAARTTAMQTATDNASDLLQELSLQYNKSRQQAITAELLDIMGGSFK